MTARSTLLFTPNSSVWRAVALAITIVGALAVASTYLAFSNTRDEPAHIAAGVQWLAGNHDFDESHPPLARIAAAIGPFLHGARPAIGASPSELGARILGRGAQYRSTLALARAGELPFFFLLCGVAWAWGRRLTDERGGAVAVLLAASNPNVLAYAGLATPDIAVAATVTMALFALAVWLEERRWYTSIALGAALAVAGASDFLAVTMLAVAIPVLFAVHRRGVRPPRAAPASRGPLAVHACLTITTAIVVGWAIYGFRSGPLYEGSWLVLPAPAWFRGLIAFVGEATPGRPAFLFNSRAVGGFWYYYPLALLVKTPLPLLLLAVLGGAIAIRGLVRHETLGVVTPLAAAVAILIAVTINADDSGIRLVLAVYVLTAVLGCVAVVELWDRGATRAPAKRLVRAAVASILFGAAIVPMRAHPDHVAYFNPIAGDRPELILVDSNLDWGQDLYRLAAVMKRMHIDSIAIAYYGSASFDAAGVRNARPLEAAERPTGWIAASETMIAGVGGDGAYEWLSELQPVGRVGSSLVLYHRPEPRRQY